MNKAENADLKVKSTPMMKVGVCVMIAAIVFSSILYAFDSRVLSYVVLIIGGGIGGGIMQIGRDKRFNEERSLRVEAAEKAEFASRGFSPDYGFDLNDYRKLYYDKIKGIYYITPIFKSTAKVTLTDEDFFNITDAEKITPYENVKHNYKGRGISLFGITSYKAKDKPQIVSMGFDLTMKNRMGLKRRIEFLESPLSPDSGEYKKLKSARHKIMNIIAVLKENYDEQFDLNKYYIEN